jgi:Zn-dependent protease with chaperone function
MQRYWSAALAAAIIAAGALAAAYIWGLPAVAESLAFQLPQSVLQEMGVGSLKLLDKTMLKPSAVPPERQHAVRAAFGRLAVPDNARTDYRIEFRKGGAIGANALALPDGTIVLTDELVALAGDDEEILAVLAHELGHLNRRHSVRMLIQGSIVAFIVAWYVGDVSNVAAGLPILLLQARYSRTHESEADRFAGAMLKANGISPRRLSSMLARMEAARDGAAREERKPRGQSGTFDYLSSHPATAERIRQLEEQR